jgi:hypothetical protein
MSKIVGDLFQGPSCFSRTMGEIVPQIMKREVSNQFPLLLVRLAFQCPEPVMDASFGELGLTLRREDIGAALIAPAVPKIVIEGASRFIEQIDVTELLSLVSDTEPADLGSNMRVFHL